MYIDPILKKENQIRRRRNFGDSDFSAIWNKRQFPNIIFTFTGFHDFSMTFPSKKIPEFPFYKFHDFSMILAKIQFSMTFPGLAVTLHTRAKFWIKWYFWKISMTIFNHFGFILWMSWYAAADVLKKLFN